MEPCVSKRVSRRLGSSSVWIGLWLALALAGITFMMAPLLWPPTTLHGQGQDVASTSASPTALPVQGTQPGDGVGQFPVPIWLNVPKANIAGSIIPVGVDAHGSMAAPEGTNDDPVWGETFWWKYGPMPGQAGNAVIGGHLDRKDGSPAIFWDLRQLTVGDSVFVRTVLGATLRFVVTAVNTVPNSTGSVANPVMQRIFGPAQTANLNLITCSGTWTGTEYNQKLVVFTTLVP